MLTLRRPRTLALIPLILSATAWAYPQSASRPASGPTTNGPASTRPADLAADPELEATFACLHARDWEGATKRLTDYLKRVPKKKQQPEPEIKKLRAEIDAGWKAYGDSIRAVANQMHKNARKILEQQLPFVRSLTVMDAAIWADYDLHALVTARAVENLKHDVGFLTSCTSSLPARMLASDSDASLEVTEPLISNLWYLHASLPRHEQVDAEWTGYGDGTFILHRSLAPQWQRVASPAAADKGNRSTEKPITDPRFRGCYEHPSAGDVWWRSGSTRDADRVAFLLSVYAESPRSKFQIVGTELRGCAGCGGKGTRRILEGNGRSYDLECPQCHGACKVRRLHFR
ncbi:MAG: hypothetical protein JNJ88_10505 [Planctomycetes bacterium]|nr:hypothetical protein [Planctomycetota bacterium]